MLEASRHMFPLSTHLQVKHDIDTFTKARSERMERIVRIIRISLNIVLITNRSS